MKLFIIRICVFLSIFFIGDRLLAMFLRSYRPIDYKRFIEAKQEIFRNSDKDYDLLIIGDSHIADALDSRPFKNVGIRAFNLGVYHSSPFEWYYLLLGCLENLSNPPEYLIIGTNPDMFTRQLEVGKYTPLILADLNVEYELYSKSMDGLTSAFFLETLKEQYLFVSVVKKMNGQKYIPTRVIANSENGYLETVNQIRGTEWGNFAERVSKEVNQKQIDYFARMIELALQNNIKPIIVNSPLWRNSLESKRNTEYFKTTQVVVDSIVAAYNISVFNKNYDALKHDLKKSDFLNTEHLNSFGAAKFTDLLIQDFHKL